MVNDYRFHRKQAKSNEQAPGLAHAKFVAWKGVLICVRKHRQAQLWSKRTVI